MVSDKDLKRIIDKAKSDPVFFDDLFADPKKALANAGLDRSVVTAKDDDCWGITCSWTCSWTGSVQRGVERGALSAADCGGITCSWTCSWTGFARPDFAERVRLDTLRDTSDCGGITCSWTCSWTGGLESQFKERVNPGALSAADCGGITCGWTCSWTGFRQEIDKGRPVRSA